MKSGTNKNTGIPKSDECRIKMRAARLGKKHSPETIAKIRASVLARIAGSSLQKAQTA